MYFSNSILDTDTDFKDWRYCRGCTESLRRSGQAVRLQTGPDLPGARPP